MTSPCSSVRVQNVALALRAAAERQHHRQRDLALAEIVADILAELGRLAAVVERVVDELEGDAEIHAERAAGGVLGLRPVGEHRPDLAGGGEQLGGLGADHGEIFVLGGRGVLGGAELHHLALGDDGGGDRQDVERAQRADLDHHLERLAEQEIADQHARLVAPQHARRGLAAPHLALVDDVVVQQRRGVHELDRGGELDVAVAGIAGQSCAIARVSIGRSRLPPDEIRWLATSGIIVTSEPVRDRIVALTRSMSGATSSTRRSIDGVRLDFRTG